MIHDFLGSGKSPNFGSNSHYVSHQYFKLDIKPAAEKLSAYATILASEFVFALVMGSFKKYVRSKLSVLKYLTNILTN